MPPKAQKLSPKVKRIQGECVTRIEVLSNEHGVYEKLVFFSIEAEYPVSNEVAKALEGLDQLDTN